MDKRYIIRKLQEAQGHFAHAAEAKKLPLRKGERDSLRTHEMQVGADYIRAAYKEATGHDIRIKI